MQIVSGGRRMARHCVQTRPYKKYHPLLHWCSPHTPLPYPLLLSFLHPSEHGSSTRRSAIDRPNCKMASAEPIVVEDEDNQATESQVINEVSSTAREIARSLRYRNTRSGRRSSVLHTIPQLYAHISTPFLYDTVITHALTWPSLTCQWLPDEQT